MYLIYIYKLLDARVGEEWGYVNIANQYLVQQHDLLSLGPPKLERQEQTTWKSKEGKLIEMSTLLENIKYENDLMKLLVGQLL